jgi:hypothetical protein
MRCCVTWTDRVRSEEVLHGVKQDTFVLHIVKRRKANWVFHILRRKCLLNHGIGGKIEGRREVMGRR